MILLASKARKYIPEETFEAYQFILYVPGLSKSLNNTAIWFPKASKILSETIGSLVSNLFKETDWDEISNLITI